MNCYYFQGALICVFRFYLHWLVQLVSLQHQCLAYLVYISLLYSSLGNQGSRVFNAIRVNADHVR